MMTHKKTKGIVKGIAMGLILAGLFAIAGESAIVNAATEVGSTPGGANESIYVTRYLPDIIKGAEGPADMIFFLYQYLMGLVGVVAVGVIMYGGVLRTMSADPSKIRMSNEYIKNALKGIVLLFGAQVLFNTINPNIIDISRIQKALQPDERIVPNQFVETLINLGEGTGTSTTAVGTGAYEGRPLADVPITAMRDALEDKGIILKKECTPGGSTSGCISFNGVKQITLDGMVSMAQAGVPITVTSVTEGSHAAGDYSHANGYKWDMSASPAVEAAFKANPQRFQVVSARSDSYATYKDTVTGVTCSSERPPAPAHWDCTTK